VYGVTGSVPPRQARHKGELFSARIMPMEQVQRIGRIAQCGERRMNRGRSENIGWRDVARDSR